MRGFRFFAIALLFVLVSAFTFYDRKSESSNADCIPYLGEFVGVVSVEYNSENLPKNISKKTLLSFSKIEVDPACGKFIKQLRYVMCDEENTINEFTSEGAVFSDQFKKALKDFKLKRKEMECMPRLTITAVVGDKKNSSAEAKYDFFFEITGK